MVRGWGRWGNDRPPVAGVVGRESGRARLTVVPAAAERHLVPAVRKAAKPGAAVSTDESKAYLRLSWDGYKHSAVRHARKEWARDDDGDREVHCNTAEGLWTGLRNFLRPFRGVNKIYLQQYVTMYQWSRDLKAVTDDFLRTLLGAPRKPATTGPGT